MPVDELTALGQKMRQARKNAGLTQQELSDQSHVSVKQIANIEKGKMNPSYLILRALARVLHISLDTLINPDISLDDERATQKLFKLNFKIVQTAFKFYTQVAAIISLVIKTNAGSIPHTTAP